MSPFLGVEVNRMRMLKMRSLFAEQDPGLLRAAKEATELF